MEKKGIIIVLFIINALFLGIFIEKTERTIYLADEVKLKPSSVTVPLWNFTVDTDFFNFHIWEMYDIQP